MKYIVYILLFFPVWVTAQTYKYIGIEDGLSNRRIFNIQKDAQGYMWFLTNEGMDRYNGKDIKHYKLRACIFPSISSRSNIISILKTSDKITWIRKTVIKCYISNQGIGVIPQFFCCFFQSQR